MGQLDFQEKWGIKSSIFSRLAGAAPRGRRGQGFTVWYSVRITIRLYFSGTLPPGTGKKYGLYENLAVPKSGQKVWFRFKHVLM